MVNAPDYTMCLPQKWDARVSDHEDKVELYHGREIRECQSLPFGVPERGAIVITIMPADPGSGLSARLEDLTARAKAAGNPPVAVNLPNGVAGHERKCWLARQLVPGGI